MPELLEALILGLVQGLTEFLPVSSSGHLEIAKYILNNDQLASESLMTSVILHFATALATIVVFRKEVYAIFRQLFSSEMNSGKKYALYIVISMIPAALVGFLWEDYIARLFDGKIRFVSLMLIVTAIILFVSERLSPANSRLNGWRSLIIGISQAFALLPGISRSGATIGTALLLGIEREPAARFSFLMVVPLILGKIFYDLISGELQEQAVAFPYLLTGFVAAFLSGMMACVLMIKIVKLARLKWFALYCLLAGSFIFIYTLV